MAASRVDIDGAAIHELFTSTSGELARFLVKKGLQVEARAKQICPVDTGRLKNSITSTLEVDPDTIKAVIGTDVEYASFVELGTVRMPAHPFLLPALIAVMQGTH